MVNIVLLCEIIVYDCRIKRSARKSMFVLSMVGLAMTSSDAVLTNQHSAPLSQLIDGYADLVVGCLDNKHIAC